MLSRDIIGQRAAFYGDAGNPVLFVYFVYRQGLNPDEAWITRKMVIIEYWLFRCWRCSRQGYSIWREGGRYPASDLWMDLSTSFMTRVLSSNVMKRAYMYRDKIPSDQTYILEFLHSGIFARLFGIRVYHGNTVEHALHGEALHMRWVTP